jgi:sodium transport system permease protein
MNWQNIKILLTHELRMLLRDRRTIILGLLLPLIILPVIFFASKSIEDARQKKKEKAIYKYAVNGSEAESARTRINRALALSHDNDEKDKPAELNFQEVVVKDPVGSLKKNEIAFCLEALSGKEADALPKKQIKDKDEDPTKKETKVERLAGVPLIIIRYQGDTDASSQGSNKMRALLQREAEHSRQALLQMKGFKFDPAKVMSVDDKDVATAGQTTGAYVGKFLTLFIVMLMLTGGSVAAMDIVAGEKERGSLETLLTTAVKRVEIVAAKQLAILIVALTITFVQIAEILAFVTFKTISLPKSFVLDAPPKTVITLLFLLIPVAVFISSILLMISAKAKSYKEAQLYFFPVYLISWIPSLAAVLPNMPLRSAIVIVPLANVSVAVREIMIGRFDWLMIGLVFIAMSAVSIWMARISAKMLSQETLITAGEFEAADFEGGAALFSKHVLRWYAILLVILFVIAVNVPQLATFRRQLLFNELGIFLAGSLLMIAVYKLNIKEAWALRLPKPAVWPAILLLIPSGNIIGIGVFRLADLIIPVPNEMLEQFSNQVLPKDVPGWQMIFFLALLPAIFEEIAFRGTLLYGLRRKYRPVKLAVVIGLIFGLFHVALFRIIPTGVLGIMLTAVALLTGSIFPGMLMHFGNNAFAYFASIKNYPIAQLPWWGYLAALVVFIFSFWVIYRNRTPYPDLRAKK